LLVELNTDDKQRISRSEKDRRDKVKTEKVRVEAKPQVERQSRKGSVEKTVKKTVKKEN